MNKGKLFIISAPSGAGKTSLVKQITTELDQLTVSISHTTRTMREGEIHGTDYFFSTVTEFQEMISNQAFLEHAQVFDNFYGTAKQSVDDCLENGLDVILEIDWQGAQQVRKMCPDCISIFILPPSIKVLQQRLENRGQDNAEIINRRMLDAVKEMSHCNEFDYMVVNDDFNQALTELRSIIITHGLDKNSQLDKLAPLLKNLIGSDERSYCC